MILHKLLKIHLMVFAWRTYPFPQLETKVWNVTPVTYFKVPLQSEPVTQHMFLFVLYLCWLQSWRWRWRQSTGRHWTRSRSADAFPPTHGCWKTPNWRRSPSETLTSCCSPNLKEGVNFNTSVWEDEPDNKKQFENTQKSVCFNTNSVCESCLFFLDYILNLVCAIIW